MAFYRLYAYTAVEEYAEPDDSIRDLDRACLTSEFQFLDRSAITVGLSDESGLQFPDFILSGPVPLVSVRFRSIFEQNGIDNLYYKPIQLVADTLGIAEQYWLALPPRINCLDLERSIIEVEENRYLPENQRMRTVKKPVISSVAVGNYMIFKLAGVVNQDIYITENLHQAIASADLENVHFAKVEE